MYYLELYMKITAIIFLMLMIVIGTREVIIRRSK